MDSAAIGGGRDDQPLDVLDTPAALDKLGGQPVEQFGVAWRASELAEVARVRGQAAAEMPLPETVDEHAGRERVFGSSDPAGERGATAGGAAVLGGNDRGEFSTEHGGSSRLDRGRVARPGHGDRRGGRPNITNSQRRRGRLGLIGTVRLLEVGEFLGDRLVAGSLFVGETSRSESQLPHRELGELLLAGRALLLRLEEHRLDLGREAVGGQLASPGLRRLCGPLDLPEPAPQFGDLRGIGPLGIGQAGGVGRDERHVVPPAKGSEERLQLVIVALQDRIKLVVVAAGTAHAHRQKDVAGDVGHLVEDVAPGSLDVGDVVFVGGLS